MDAEKIEALKAERAYLLSEQLKKKEIEAAKKASSSLLNFTAYTMRDFEVNWHHKVLCAYLDAFVAKKIRRLMVFMPPRHGKSELVSRRLPAYIHGKDPNARVVCASYSQDLASSMLVDVQGIMDSEEYQTVFPESPILRKGMKFRGLYPKRTSSEFEIARQDASGSNRAVGVGGSLTGFGFDYGIIDDPFKNRQEADSETYRKNVWNWYTSTFLTRQDSKDAGICLLMTRWHEDDLAGRLLKKMQEDPEADQWVVLVLPAIAGETPKNINDRRKPGEALWPSKYDEKFLAKMKSADSRDFEALYNQDPFTEGGAILKKHWFRYYEPHELPKFLDQILISVDCAFKDTDGSDYVVLQTWGRKGADKYLIDQRRDKLDFNETCTSVTNLRLQYPHAREILVEDKANGPAVIASLTKRISGLIPINPTNSKVARARAITPQLRSGNVYLPVPSTCVKFDVDLFVDECAKFPNASNDDQVDAMTQALSYMEEGEAWDLRRLAQK